MSKRIMEEIKYNQEALTDEELRKFFYAHREPREYIIPVGQKTLEAFNKVMQEDYERRNSAK